MSDYQGNIVIKNPATPTGPSTYGRAPGMWKLSEVAYWIKQGVWPNPAIVPDTYFPYVSLLLSTTSLGNANNNLFVDSSGAFNPISRNANTTQGSFTPYSTNWSNYFDGSGDYLSAASNAAFGLGTGDFTIEMWVFPTANPANGPGTIFDLRSGATATATVARINASLQVLLYNGPANTEFVTGTVSLNTWTHIAFVRSSGTVRTYINGTLSNTTTMTSDLGSNQPCFIGVNRTAGYEFNGNISNFRIVKGTAVYTSDFTVPTAPLTAISGTSILTCQSNRFLDTSSNNFTITVTGNTSVQDFGPFNPTYPGAVYNQSDITNWSGYFDGSADYLTIPTNSAFGYGTGDFTIEFWLNLSGVPAAMTVVSNLSSASGTSPHLYISTDGTLRYYTASVDRIISSVVPLQQWIHVALCRSSGSTRMFFNGVQTGSTYSDSNNYGSSNPVGIATYWNGTPVSTNTLFGYLSNLRILNGVGLYTTTFTPPTTNLTAVSGTSLLTLQNAAFTDNSTNSFIITQYGNTTVTGNSPFNPVGYWSNYFDGNGDYLQITSAAALQFGTGDFTVEFWLNLIARDTSGAAIFNNYNSFTTGALGFFAGHASANTGKYQVAVNGTFPAIQSSANVTYGQWDHFAIVRNGNTLTLYINGVADGTFSVSGITLNGVGSFWWLGSAQDAPSNYETNGYLSNFRVVKGTAVYTANFTPPTTPLTAITNTSLLTCQNGRFIDNSTNNFTLTAAGNTSAQSFDPFYTATIASNGGSMYFDGSGDWLLSPSNPGFALGTGDFIVEVWANPSVQGGHGSGNNDCLIDFRSGNGGGAYGTLYLNNSGTYVGWYANTVNQILAPGIPNNAWSHLVVSRVSGTTRMFINGVQSGSFTDSINYLQGRVALGQFDDGVGAGWFQGYMSGARIVKGTGISANFTPPTAPRTPTPATTLMINGMNAGIYDATTINDMETVGNAQVTTAVSKYGGSSVYFDGTGDRITAAPTENMNLATGDFTVEGWFYTNSISGDASAITRAAAGNIATGAELQWGIYRSGSSMFVRPYQGTTDFSINVGTISTGTWYHVAMTRSGNTIRGFLNGVLAGTTQTISGALNNNTLWYGVLIGGITVSSVDQYWNGYMDDIRITKGVARYTANFTPPTQAFPIY